MRLTNSNIAGAIQAMRASGDAVQRARAENVLMEERVSPDRQARYETGFPPAKPTSRAWSKSHGEYLAGSVFIEWPETFQALNADAALPAAVTSGLGAEQYLVRVESLDYALTHTKITSVIDLEQKLAVYHGQKRDDHFDQGDAKAALEEVCRSLNNNPNAIRPRFAAFEQELDEDIKQPDWAILLRDRLGLAHLMPTAKIPAFPVALMRYKVEEVVKAANRARRVGGAELAHPVTVPTVLDAEPYEIFHPSPRGANYGRTLNLDGAGDCGRLASEVLHLRIDYQPSHILKVGVITVPVVITPEKLVKLRENHLLCLKIQSGQDDFGDV
ncbi:MAG: hypothetical protein WCF85_16640 [Rhodospirillaceae bacterium]